MVTVQLSPLLASLPPSLPLASHTHQPPTTRTTHNTQVAIKLYVKPGLTKVDILDFSLSSHVNFEAEIHAVEESGIVQVEQFGIR